MNDQMQTTVIVAFFSFLLVICFTIIGVLLMTWWKEQKAEQNATRAAISALSENIHKLSEKFVLKTDYDRDMDALKLMRPLSNCPLEETTADGARRTEVIDAGFKRLTDLLSAVRNLKPTTD
jgi:hypothetical protein